MSDFADLNFQQQQAVMAGPGPVLVMAGPGSGKTRVLTQRIAYLISHLGVRPYNILAVTFTNKAAREMEDRVMQSIGQDTRGMTLGTFHAICVRLLRREAEHLPFQSNFVIFDEDDQLSLTRQALKEFNLDEKRYRPQTVHNAISNAKNELLLPDEFPVQNYRDEIARRVYKRYQELLLANNALDFDDLLLWAAFLLENQPQVRERYARQYEHILVDEFQDTNLAQYALVKRLSSFHGNIFVVGDTDQSIYRWRGADYRNLLRFQEDFPAAQVILLEQNYRSTQAILDTAMAVIDRHPYRMPKRLFTERGQGQKALLFEAQDDRMEAAFVVETIASLVQRQQARPGDCAVMYRTNAQSRLLEEAFIKAGLPYRLVGAQRFYGRREIKDIIAYLRLIHNPQDELSLGRVINVPARKIGDKTYLALLTQARKDGTAPAEFLMQLARNFSPDGAAKVGEVNSLSGRAAYLLANFGALLSGWVALRDTLPPLSMMDRVLEGVAYHAYIDDGSEEGKDRWENVMELRRLAAEFQEPGLGPFLERVALVSDQDTVAEAASAPTLLTLHAAKGLEFPIVFLVGLNDGVLPHSRSFDDPEGMLEERRLLYVGLTRARDRVYLSFSQMRNAFGYAEPAISSRFLDDIPYALFDEIYTNRSGRPERQAHHSSKGQASERLDRWQVPERAVQGGGRVIKPAAPVYTQQFQPGMRVQHPTWGEGLVLNSRLQEDDEIVDIHFQSVGLKRLLASLAGLQVVSS